MPYNSLKRQLTSATTPMQPHMVAAFGCAPLIPPKPEDTNTYCIFHIYKNKYDKKLYILGVLLKRENTRCN